MTGRAAGRRIRPVPDTGWSTVRFGRRLRPDTQPSGQATGVAAVVWRSAAGRGIARVLLEVAGDSAGSGVPPGGGHDADVHRWADPDAPGPSGRTECADLLVGRTPLAPDHALLRAHDLLARHQGCLIAAVPHTTGGCVTAVRGAAEAVWWQGGTRGTGLRAHPHILASVLHAWLVAGGAPGCVRSVSPVPRGRSRAQDREVLRARR
ncbi:hypothetical protein [Streptomyces sp. NPDC048644]|uniref:hypothetical protein n=1 Tax=Streptomyces sp. NPDC048644 TaxID=3365582 RepID=UPI0037141202